MSHEERSVATGRVQTLDLGEEVRISLTGMFYGRGFTFSKESLTGVDDDVELDNVRFYEDERSAQLQAMYSGRDIDYIATIRLNDYLDIDGEPSRSDFLKIMHASERDSWPDSKLHNLWPMDKD